MKRTERQHLKENELARSIMAARDLLENRSGQLMKLLLALVVIAAGIAGITWWQQRGNAAAERSLADAMIVLSAPVVPPSATPEAPGELPAAASMAATGSYPSEAAKLNAALPRLKTTADAYPSSDAGITARYHYASALSSLGRHDEAIQAYDEVISRAGADSLYGRMARLGKADTQMHATQFDAAIATWTELAASTDEDLPKDAILMELAKAYEAKGDMEGAKKVYTQLIDEHPTSPYTAEARAELGN